MYLTHKRANLQWLVKQLVIGQFHILSKRTIMGNQPLNFNSDSSAIANHFTYVTTNGGIFEYYCVVALSFLVINLLGFLNVLSSEKI